MSNPEETKKDKELSERLSGAVEACSGNDKCDDTNGTQDGTQDGTPASANNSSSDNVVVGVVNDKENREDEAPHGFKRHIDNPDDDDDDDNKPKSSRAVRFVYEDEAHLGYFPQDNGASNTGAEGEGPSGSRDDACRVVPSHVTHVMHNLENIIRNIFQCLPIRSLHNAARVCRKWQEVADVEKESRHQISWTFAEIHRTHHVLGYITNPIFNSYSLPAVTLMFVTQELYEHKLEVPLSHTDAGDYHSGVGIVPKRRRRKSSVLAYMEEILPPGCAICGLVADGVVGTYYNKYIMKEIERGDGISCLNIPKLPGVEVTRFRLGESDLDSLHIARGDLRAVTDMPDDHEAMLTLLFYEDSDLSMLPVAPSRVIAENKSSRVVAGGFVHNILRDNLSNYNPLTLKRSGRLFPGRRQRAAAAAAAAAAEAEGGVTGLIFSAPQGSQHVKVASVYMDHDVHSEASARAVMSRLLKCHIPLRNTLGFMLSCCARGSEHYAGKESVESAAFHALFPGVPLVGLFGQGEICHNYLPDYDSAESVREWKEKAFEEAVYHSYCCAIVLLHLGECGGKRVV